MAARKISAVWPMLNWSHDDDRITDVPGTERMCNAGHCLGCGHGCPPVHPARRRIRVRAIDDHLPVGGCRVELLARLQSLNRAARPAPASKRFSKPRCMPGLFLSPCLSFLPWPTSTACRFVPAVARPAVAAAMPIPPPAASGRTTTARVSSDRAVRCDSCFESGSAFPVPSVPSLYFS